MRKPRGERDSFLTPLVVEVMPSGKRFRLFLPFTFQLPEVKYRVPAGFVTDFASIPRFARVLIPKLGRYNKAAVLHDAIYQNAAIPVMLNRKGADLTFLGGMVALGVAPWKRRLMYWAVRLGGWAAWKKRK